MTKTVEYFDPATGKRGSLVLIGLPEGGSGGGGGEPGPPGPAGNTMLHVITENDCTVERDSAYGVAPYSTSYRYTNITINTLTEDDLAEGCSLMFMISTAMVVNSSYRNVRIRFGESGRWVPVYGTTAILAGSSFFVKGQFRIYEYSETVNTDGAFHMLTDSNSTYAAYSFGIGYGTCSTAAATAAKAVVLTSYTLANGGICAVKFDNAVPANATMNINSKGAKPIYYRGAAIAADVIQAGDVATFIYSTVALSGGCYVLLNIDRRESGGGAVSSVNGQTGAVVITAAGLGALTEETDPTVPDHVKAITEQDIANWNAGGTGGGVSSVNGQTGAVTLGASDVGAMAANPSEGSGDIDDNGRVVMIENNVGVKRSTWSLWEYIKGKVNALLDGKNYAVTSDTVNFARATAVSATFADRSCTSGKWVCVGTITVPANRRPLVTVLARFASNSTGRRAVTLTTVANAIGTELSSQPSQTNLMATDIRAAVNGAYSYAAVNTGGSMPTEARVYYVYVYQNSGSALNVSSRYTVVLMNE